MDKLCHCLFRDCIATLLTFNLHVSFLLSVKIIILCHNQSSQLDSENLFLRHEIEKRLRAVQYNLTNTTSGKGKHLTVVLKLCRSDLISDSGGWTAGCNWREAGNSFYRQTIERCLSEGDAPTLVVVIERGVINSYNWRFCYCVKVNLVNWKSVKEIN